MSSLNNFDFPYLFPPPPTPPSHPISPPPPPYQPYVPPPPPYQPYIPPPPPYQPYSPPPPYQPQLPPPPYVLPPPPRHPISPPPPPHQPHTPPPPHVHPPPPLPPPPSPDNHPTVIIIVIVSCGGLFLLAFLAFALCCFIKKKKKKKIEETDIVHVDEHLKVKGAIVPGSHGQELVVLEVEDDVHVNEKIIKKEKVGKGLHHAKSAGENQSIVEAGASSSAILAFLVFALCCFIKKKKKKKVEETDIVRVDEHLKIKEAIVPCHHGQELVVLEIEDDIHVDEEIIKKEKAGKGLHHAKSAGENQRIIEAGASSSAMDDHHPQHKY